METKKYRINHITDQSSWNYFCSSGEYPETIVADDSLFNSYAWQSEWWRTWGDGMNTELLVVVVMVANRCVCSLPLYTDKLRIKKVIPIKRLQFLATNYQRINSPRAEYISVLYDNNYLDTGAMALDSLERKRWSELVARDIVLGGNTSSSLIGWAKSNNWLVRTIHRDITYIIDCRKDFKSYIKSRGPNTRLKLYNRRKLLSTLGEGKVELINFFPDRVDVFFHLLGQFHLQRWGESFSKKTISFHKNIIKGLTSSGIDVDLSVLTVNGNYESVMMNYKLNGKVYNINSGFNEGFHKKISIGLLHFGYIIERAFTDPTINYFDFLAGQGKNSNYKSKLATSSVKLHSIQIVRTKSLKLLYKIKDTLDYFLVKAIK